MTVSNSDVSSGSGAQYPYFVDGKPYSSTEAVLTGAQIKAQIPDFDPTYQLVLEGREGEPDKLVNDDDSINLDVHPRRHFYTVPPATFGC